MHRSDKSKHIVIDARFFRKITGGIGRYTRALIRELILTDRINRYTVILSPADEPDWQTFASEIRLKSTDWQTCVVDIPHYSLAEQIKLPKVLASLAPDLVHFTNFNHPLSWNRPFVITIHDLTIFKYPVGPKQRSPIAQLAFRAVIRHALARAKKIITISNSSKHDLVRYFSARSERLEVIYEGIDPAYQPTSLAQRGRVQNYLKAQFNIRSPYILFVSQWRPHKGLGVLVNAYHELRDKYPKLIPQLVLVGKPHPDYPEILKLIETSRYRRDIIMPGFVDEEVLPKLYQGAEVFVFPSLYEGFGLPPLEAMACGAPVVASRASCLPEILGQSALFARPDDPHELADTLAKIFTDHKLWRAVRAAGFEEVKKYSWHEMADETLKVYESSCP